MRAKLFGTLKNVGVRLEPWLGPIAMLIYLAIYIYAKTNNP